MRREQERIVHDLADWRCDLCGYVPRRWRDEELKERVERPSELYAGESMGGTRINLDVCLTCLVDKVFPALRAMGWDSSKQWPEDGKEATNGKDTKNASANDEHGPRHD